jgi:hypothetical protein
VFAQLQKVPPKDMASDHGEVRCVIDEPCRSAFEWMP